MSENLRETIGCVLQIRIGQVAPFPRFPEPADRKLAAIACLDMPVERLVRDVDATLPAVEQTANRGICGTGDSTAREIPAG
jgi:hypothetical protein